MPEITLDVSTFKLLASDTRLDILKALDGRKMTLQELTSHTNMQKATLHEHLSKLTQAELVKRHQRQGHKWVYYDLSWKAKCLLHPETGRVAVLIGLTVFSLLASIWGTLAILFNTVGFIAKDGGADDMFLLTSPETSSELLVSTAAPLLGFVCFALLLAVTIWRIQKNKTTRI